MEDAVKRALRRKRELEQELAEIELFLKVYARFSDRTNIETGDSPDINAARQGEAAETTYRILARPLRRRANPAEFAEMAARIIRDERRPLSRTELVEALEKREVELPSQDKPRYLGTILWRNRDRFINIPNKGYYLAELMTAEEIADAQKAGQSDDPEEIGDLEDAHRLNLAKLAYEFCATMDRQAAQKLREHLETQTTIPPEIDRRLIAVSRDKAGRTHFSDEEKRVLRLNFKDALNSIQ